MTGTFENGHFEGTLSYEDGSSYHWTSHRAPALKRKGAPKWGTPIHLFSGNNINQWHTTGGQSMDRRESRFKLHLKVKYPGRSNSGIYLRGRYEVITLIGRMVTVSVNGKHVICHREIPGITGGALDSKEVAPGPILLQGDHGPINYRNIIITPAK